MPSCSPCLASCRACLRSLQWSLMGYSLSHKGRVSGLVVQWSPRQNLPVSRRGGTSTPNYNQPHLHYLIGRRNVRLEKLFADAMPHRAMLKSCSQKKRRPPPPSARLVTSNCLRTPAKRRGEPPVPFFA